MQLQQITFFAVVSIQNFLHSAANANHGYIDFTSQQYRKNDRHGRLFLYRPIRNNNHFQDEQTLFYNRHSQPGGRVSYQNNRDVNRLQSQNEHNRWNRISLNTGPETNRQFNRRNGYGYPSNYNSQRKQNFHHDREESIADYVKHYNFQNNPHSTFYNGPNDSNFNPPIEEEIIIEDEPEDYKHLIHNFQTNSVHKDLTKATFPQNRPSHGISNFPSQHRFSAGNRPLHEEHKHFYYEKPDYDTSDDSLDNKDIDPELIEIYKKVIEVYKKKQKQKNSQGKKPFYFGNQEKNNHKTPFFFQQNNPEHNPGNNYFNVPDDGTKSNILMPRHPNAKGFVFPGPVQSNNKPANPYTPFQASPQFHRYSEPDPLYHPNGNPFQLQDSPHTLPVPTPTSQVTTPLSTIAGSESPQQSTTEENKNFPDSINAQLPPPEKDADTSIPYVAATVITPKTTSETTLIIHSQTSSLTESVSEPSTMAYSPPKLYKNETFPLQDKLIQEANIASRFEPQIEIYTENLTSDNTTSSITAPATGQPELFFLPTTAEEISGSSSKESPIFQEIVQKQDLNKPTTYRRNYTLIGTTVLSPLAISPSSASSIQNNVYTSTHAISTSNNPKNKEADDILYDVKIGNEINIGEKDIGVLHHQSTEHKDENQTNNNNSVPLSLLETEILNTDELSTPEPTTITHNKTALNVTSTNSKQEYWALYFTARNEGGSETTPKRNTKKSTENTERNYANEKQIISTDKKVEHNYTIKLNDSGKQYSTSNKIPEAHESEKNNHYLMSIINQVRSHVILSQNDTQVEDALLH